MAEKTTKKASPTFKTIPTGTTVSWPYRSGTGHGSIAGIHKKGTNAGNTEYSIRQTDHHVGENPIVFHYGKALTRKSKK